MSPLKGILGNGEQEYVYMFMLYCDDFVARSLFSPEGSVSFCYLVPLYLSLCHRKAALCISTIYLSPAGMPLNVILDSLIPYKFKGSIERFGSVNTLENRAKICLSLCGLLCSYPASSQVLHVPSI